MLHNPGMIGGNGPELALLSPDIQAAIKTELQSMLKAPIFAQSGRCKKFLSHVVFETLSGNAGELKERTIGINVFNRANDYETGDDSIVRVTANEVRKRIGQFYAESPDPHSIQIELPRGSYVPEFKIQPSKAGRTASAHLFSSPASDLPFGEAETAEGLLGTGPAPISSPSSVPDANQRKVHNPKPHTTQKGHKSWVYLAIIGILVLAGSLVGALQYMNLKRVPDVWGSFQNTSSPVLICVDAHDLHLKPTPSPEDGTFANLVLYRQIITLDDAAVLSSMTSMLGKLGVPFRVVGAQQTSLADFRRQPVILVGAIDNKWTLRLTQELRYRIDVTNPPGSGSVKAPVASIVDSENPTSARWTTDLSVPFAAWKSDYAIVARMDDSTTGVPVLIEAGLGNTGSLAASELISSGEWVASLRSEAACRTKRNFEAVVETQIIDTKPGPPHVLRLTCW